MRKQYFFEEITHCEMCGDSTASHPVLGQRLNQSQGMRPRAKHGISVSVLQCPACDLIYANPQPIPADIQDHYGTPAETYWKPEYFQWTPEYYAPQLAALEQLMPQRPGMTALDIGAGIGKCMLSMEKAGFEVYGFEPSKPFFEKALSQMGIPPDRLQLGMVEDVRYPGNFFDFITFGAVFEHLYHPAQALEKAMSWLKPSGIIHIEVPSANHFIPKLINAYYRLIGVNYVTNISPMHSPFHMYEFGLKSFEKLAHRLNYELIKYEYSVCDIYSIPKVFHPLLRTYMERTNTGMQLTVWLRKK
jgi:2-polyprenyl-3-methyl-5-hydroxy-6-metoxy-1,4-benzoquinol methylase